MKKVLILGVVFTIAACSTTSDSTKDIVPIGKDTYMVGRAGSIFVDSGSEVKAQLFKDANAFCISQGKVIMPISTKQEDKIMGVSAASAELQFRCLNENDPELRRPNLQPAQ